MIIGNLKRIFSEKGPKKLGEYKEIISEVVRWWSSDEEFRGDIFCMPYTNEFKELDSLIPVEIMKELIPWAISKSDNKFFESYLTNFSINKRSEMCDKYLEEYVVTFFVENKKRNNGLDVLDIVGKGRDNLSKMTIDDIFARDKHIMFYVVRHKSTEDGRWMNDRRYFMFHEDAERRLKMLKDAHNKDNVARPIYEIYHDYITGPNHSEVFSSDAYLKMVDYNEN